MILSGVRERMEARALLRPRQRPALSTVITSSVKELKLYFIAA